MELSLSTREVEVLGRLLSNSLGDLREQVYKTENYEWRKDLQQDEEILKGLLERLGRPVENNVSRTRVA